MFSYNFLVLSQFQTPLKIALVSAFPTFPQSTSRSGVSDSGLREHSVTLLWISGPWNIQCPRKHQFSTYRQLLLLSILLWYKTKQKDNQKMGISFWKYLWPSWLHLWLSRLQDEVICYLEEKYMDKIRKRWHQTTAFQFAPFFMLKMNNFCQFGSRYDNRVS